MYNESGNAWDTFFGNPLIKTYLTENAQEMAMGVRDDAQVEPQNQQDIQQLAGDLQDGTLTQDDLVNMYQTGAISKEDIQSIIGIVQGEGGEGEPPQDPNAMINGEEQPPTEEELLAQQIDQTNDLFVKFSIYDKVNELTDKLDYFKDNFEDVQSDMYERVVQLREFLNILSNLIFNIETAVSYQMYGSILLQLTEIFGEYNAISGEDAQANIIRDKMNEDYRSGQKTTDPVANWANKNQSDEMNQDHDYTTTNEHLIK